MKTCLSAHKIKADEAFTFHPLCKSPKRATPIARLKSSNAAPKVAPKSAGLSLQELQKLIIATLEDYKARDLVIIPLAGRASFADALILATGTSSRHISSMADALDETLRKADHAALGVEGQEAAEWVCVDAGDIVVHLFQPEARQLYNLEKLWSFPAEKEPV